MYIKQLTIKNYRNFGDPPFTIDLKPFTLILGENNIGKTNLLNALGLLFSQEIMIFRKRVLELDDVNYATIRRFKEQVRATTLEPDEVIFPEVLVEATLTGMNADQEAVIGDWFSNKELTEAKIAYLFAPKASFDKQDWVSRKRAHLERQSSSEPDIRIRDIDFPIDEYRYSIYGGGDPSNECNAYFLRMLKMEFLDALRDAQKELIASGDYRLLFRILSQRDAANYDSIRAILVQLEEDIEKNQNLKDIRTEVKELLDRVSLAAEQDSDNKIGFSFSSPDTSEMLKKIGLVYGSDPISVDRNGLGRNNLLYISLILSHLTVREGNDKEVYFRLIGIEEPEAHLHPHLQDHLARNIESIREERDETMQLVLTSHSTQIAARLNLANTAILYRSRQGDALRAHYVLSGLDPVSDKPTIHYLSKFLDATKSRMFFARKVILVEGIAEQLLIPRMFEFHFGRSMEQVGCNIINVNGVAFSHFLKVIRNGYFIRCVVLTDSDQGKATAERATDLKKEFDQVELTLIQISEHNTFENDLILANRSGKGKDILLAALKSTKPVSGAALEGAYADRDLDTATFFKEIEAYKAEFAFNLAELLKKTTDSSGFTIPTYVRLGFDFLR